MDTAHKILSKRLMDGTVSLDPAHRRERVRRNPHPKMTLATFPVTRMASVALAFVGNLQHTGLERPDQPRAHFLHHHHFFGYPPFQWRLNT